MGSGQDKVHKGGRDKVRKGGGARSTRGGGDSVHVCVLPSYDLHYTVCALTKGPNYRRLGGWGNNQPNIWGTHGDDHHQVMHYLYVNFLKYHIK